MRRLVGVMSGGLVTALVMGGSAVTIIAQGASLSKGAHLRLALSIAHEALSACRAQNFRASVAVLDHTNTLSQPVPRFLHAGGRARRVAFRASRAAGSATKSSAGTSFSQPTTA